MTEVTEYAIRWLAPNDVSESVTVIGKGTYGRELAIGRLTMTRRLPGGLRGKVVKRTITTGEWEEL